MLRQAGAAGSSVGITKAHDEDELRRGVALAFEHDEKVLVERFVTGIEVEVGVLGNLKPFASLPGEIVVTHNEWYDFEAKYDEGEMDLVVPARITDEQIERAQELAVRAFVATDCEGMARADLFVREDGEVLVNELNTIPGFTVDERLRAALRRFRHPVRRAAAAARRPCCRAVRAAARLEVLTAPKSPYPPDSIPTSTHPRRSTTRSTHVSRTATSRTRAPFGPRCAASNSTSAA